MREILFSDRVENWLADKKPKSIASLVRSFGTKSFAIIIMFLMFIPALPIPTGGVTHILEVVVLLLCLEMIAGRSEVWLPKRIKKISLGFLAHNKSVPFIVNKIRWLEGLSRPRFSGLIRQKIFIRAVGVVLFLFTLGAFLSVPFSGLDTLPSMGAVLMCFALLFDDLILLIVGGIVGSIGLSLLIGAGTVSIQIISQFL